MVTSIIWRMMKRESLTHTGKAIIISIKIIIITVMKIIIAKGK